MEHVTTDILIAGGGVAGLTAAAAFGSAGFDVMIIDPAPPITNDTDAGADLRTTAFLQPAQALLGRAGLWDRLAPWATALCVMRIVDAAGNGGQPPLTVDFNASEISDAPFGWNLPNWLLRREIVARLTELPNVAFQPGTGFVSMLARENEALVRLSVGPQVRCKLVVGADGRGSAVRQAAGIGAKTTGYGQKALTFAVTHDAPHKNISTEIHRSGGPFTLVPLPDYKGKPCSSVVWMENGPKVQSLAALDDAAFENAATERSAGLYGALKLASRRSVWPIISQIADRMSGPRTALLAEAAHVMPPIGAQGLNMSLADLDALLTLAQEGKPEDPSKDTLGSRAMLDRYHRRRHADVRLRVAGIDALNRASQARLPALQGLRAAGIKTLANVTPIRQNLMRLGLGADDSIIGNR